MDCSEDCRMTRLEHVVHIQKEALVQFVHKHKEYDTIFYTYGMSGILTLIQDKIKKSSENNYNDLNEILIDLQIYSIVALQN